MTLPKKGSRKITVNSERYRWMVRNKASHNQKQASSFMDDTDDGKVKIVIELEKAPNSLLVVITEKWHKDMFKNWDIDGTDKVAIITPSMIKKCIVVALERGWKPEQRGKPYVLNLNEEKSL